MENSGKISSRSEMKKEDQWKMEDLYASDEVWEQKDIIRFSMNTEKGIFTIGDVNYSIQNKVEVFSNEKSIELTELGAEDVLSVVGLGNRLLSIVVTKGHGVLKLVNTGLFDDSLFNLGDRVYEKVSEGVSIEVPEGTYSLTVAKDGWGSTTEVTIVRGEVTEIDLDTIKGDGPKKGFVTFKINAEDVKMFIDYKEVDISEAVELVYGTHILEVSATGYTTWRGKIMVGSEISVIEITLEEENNQPVEPTEENKNTSANS